MTMTYLDEAIDRICSTITVEQAEAVMKANAHIDWAAKIAEIKDNEADA